jgi:hypothetical protein
MIQSKTFTSLLFALTSIFLVNAYSFGNATDTNAETDGCSSSNEEKIEDLKNDISILQIESSFLLDRIAELEKENIELSGKILEVQSEILPDTIYVNLKEKGGFEKLNTRYGSLFVSPVSATPYLDGYKIILQIGNPHFCTFCNPKFSVVWRMSYKKLKEQGLKFSDWDKSKKEKEFCLQSKIEAGKWNFIELILTPCSVDELGCVELKFDCNTVSLGT